jgi:hypothetical protein
MQKGLNAKQKVRSVIALLTDCNSSGVADMWGIEGIFDKH